MDTLPPPQPVTHSVNCTSCHFLHLYRNIKGFMVQTGDPTGERSEHLVERWAWPTLSAAGVGWGWLVHVCVCVPLHRDGEGRSERLGRQV